MRKRAIKRSMIALYKGLDNDNSNLSFRMPHKVRLGGFYVVSLTAPNVFLSRFTVFFCSYICTLCFPQKNVTAKLKTRLEVERKSRSKSRNVRTSAIAWPNSVQRSSENDCPSSASRLRLTRQRLKGCRAHLRGRAHFVEKARNGDITVLKQAG